MVTCSAWTPVIKKVEVEKHPCPSGSAPEIGNWHWEKPLVNFVGILEGFDAEKGQPQPGGEKEQAGQRQAALQFRGAHRQDHGEAAQQQHGGIDGADRHQRMPTRLAENFRKAETINGIAEKQRAEEKDFRG